MPRGSACIARVINWVGLPILNRFMLIRLLGRDRDINILVKVAHIFQIPLVFLRLPNIVLQTSENKLGCLLQYEDNPPRNIVNNHVARYFQN